MKKILFALAVMIMSQVVVAQQSAVDSIGKHRGHGKHGKLRPGGPGPMKELNLSEEQKTKMKAVKEANKAKKDAIKADASLTEEQKKEQLKTIHKTEAKQAQEVLTDEQKTKFKEMKERRKREKHRGSGAITQAPAKTAE